MEDVRMDDLKISEEQVQKFQEWKEQYSNDLKFVKGVLELEIGKKECSESKTYKMLSAMESEISKLEVQETVAMSYGDRITSNMRFGFEVCRYSSNIYSWLVGYFPKEAPTLIVNRVAKYHSRLKEIFNLN